MKNYRQFISADDDKVDKISKVLERKKWPPILGTASFINRVKEKLFSEKVDDEVPQSKELAPASEQIKILVCQHYLITNDELMVSKRGVFNEPRNVAIYLTRRLRGDSLKQIGEQFEMQKYSSVGSIIERMKAKVAKDGKLKTRVESIVFALSKSQEQT